MALRSGLGSSLMLGAESTYSTFVTPTRALEFRSEELTYNRETLESQAIRKGVTMMRAGRWARNDKGGGGSTAFEVSTTAFGLVFKHALGSSVITTPGGATLARLHTHTFGDLDDLSLTIQKGVPEQDTGTVRPFNFLGCVCTGWEMNVGVDELLTFTPTWDARTMERTSPIGTPTYADGSLYGYQTTAITLATVAREPRSLSLSCTNGVATDRYVVNATGLKRRPVIAAFRELTGTLTLDFDNMTDVNHFLDDQPGSELAIEFTATHPTLIEAGQAPRIVCTMPACEITGGFPTVSGPDLITLDVTFRVRQPVSGVPLTLAYYTSDVAS